ncbi:MAG: thiol reductase thioredoxin [Bacteroidetes bacterium]|nr:MAG: thiol reductase thioredoxin [Bacteroidota bacterium]
MKNKFLSVILAGTLFCGLSSCNNVDAEAALDNPEVKVEENVAEEISVEKTVVLEETVTTDNVSGEIDNNGKVKHINTETFIAEVFDYKANPQKWVYKGTKPAIIDFYADWCGPCKKLSPIMEELAIKYKGQVNFYKINTDEEKELSGGVFGIRSIPSILFIPVEGQPQMQAGLIPAADLSRIIDNNLLNK